MDRCPNLNSCARMVFWAAIVFVVNATATIGLASDNESSDVLVRLDFILDEGNTPVKKKDLPWPLKYEVLRKHGGEWKATQYGPAMQVEATPEGNAVGILELPPGDYRIKGRTSFDLALGVDQELSLAAEDAKATKKITLFHKRIGLTECRLVLNGEGVDDLAVRVTPQVCVRRNDKRPSLWPTNTLIAPKSGEAVTFYAWSDESEISFAVGGYWHVKDNGYPQRKEYSLEELSKGATWNVATQSKTASLDVLVKVEGKVKPLTKEIMRAVLPNQPMPIFGLFLYEVLNDRGELRRLPESGFMDWSTGRLYYRTPSPGQSYAISNEATIGTATTAPAPVVVGNGAERLLKKLPGDESVPSLGSVVVELRPRRTINVSGKVADDNGRPVKDVLVSFDGIGDARVVAKTDANGRFKAKVPEGRHVAVAQMLNGQVRSEPRQVLIDGQTEVDLNWTLESLPLLSAKLSGQWPRGMSAHVRLYQPRQQHALKGLVLQKGQSDVSFGPVQPGEYLISVQLFPAVKSEVVPEFATVPVLFQQVSVQKNQNHVADVVLRKPRKMEASYEGPSVQHKALVILWYYWQGVCVPVGSAYTKELKSFECAVPASGSYVGQIVVSRNGAGSQENQWKDANSFYTEPFVVDEKTVAVKLVAIKESMHMFRLHSEPPNSYMPPTEKSESDLEGRHE